MALCALAAPLFPAESVLIRVVSPLVVILIAAITYGVLLLAFSLFERLLPRIAFVYGLIFYYAGLFGAPLTPLLWWSGIKEHSAPDDSLRYFNPMIQCQCAG
jgi:uncharacterized membrane protein YedE/YeeE